MSNFFGDIEIDTPTPAAGQGFFNDIDVSQPEPIPTTAVEPQRQGGFFDDVVSEPRVAVEAEQPQMQERQQPTQVERRSFFDDIKGVTPRPTTKTPLEASLDPIPQVDQDRAGFFSGRFFAGLGAQVLVSEGGRLGATALGAKIGAVGGPVGIGIGAATGFVLGGLAAGAAGSVTRQKIEGRENLSYGELVTDTATNLIPGSLMVKGGLRYIKEGDSLFRHTMNRIKSAAFRQGAVGSVIGAGGEIIESAIDDDKELNLRNVRDRAVLGGLLGATLGGTMEGATGLYRKIAGTTPQSLQNAIIKGDPELVRAVDMITDLANTPELTGAQRIKAIQEYVKTSAMPSLVVGKEALESIRDAAGAQRAGQVLASDIAEKVDRVIRGIPAAQRAQANEDILKYLNREIDVLPNDTKALSGVLSEYRVALQKYSDWLLKADADGVLPLPEHLKDALIAQSNDGKGWATRAYRFWSDGEFKPDQMPGWREAAHKELAEQAKWAHKSKIETTKSKLIAQLKDIKDKNTPAAQVKATSLRKKIERLENAKPLTDERASERADNIMGRWNAKRLNKEQGIMGTPKDGILDVRKDLGPMTRRYLGEIKDAPTVIEASLTKLSNLAAWSRSDAEVVTALRRAGMVSDVNEGNLAVLRGSMGEVEGVFVDPNMNRALNLLYGNGSAEATAQVTENIISDFYQTFVSMSKFTKVPLNAISYPTNLITNFFQLPQQNFMSVSAMWKGAKAASKQFDAIRRGSKSAKDVKFFNELVEHDLVQPNVITADMLEGLKRGKIGRWVGRTPVVEVAGKAYSASDIMLRTVVYQGYKDKLTREFPTMLAAIGQDGVNRLAARYTKATYQQYSYLNGGIKALSRLGIMNPFIAFTAELWRNQYNQGVLIKRMLTGEYAEEMLGAIGRVKGANQTRAQFLAENAEMGLVNQKAISRDAATRLAVTATMYSAAGFGITQIHKKRGLDEETVDALHDVVTPSYSEGQQMVFDVKPDGRIDYMDASYVLPHAQVGAPIYAGLRGDSFGDAVRAGFKSLGSQFGGELNFALQALVPMFGNYDPRSGDKLSTKEGAIENWLERIGWGVTTSLEPGVWRELRNTFGEEAKRTPDQLMKRMMGMRINSTTIEESFAFKVNEIKRDLGKSRKEYSRAERNNLLGREGAAIEKDFEDTFGRIHQQVKSMRVLGKTLGFNDDDIAGMLQDNGFGGANIIHALRGTVPPIKVDRSNTVGGKWDAIQELPAGERLAVIKSEENLNHRRDLMRRYKQDAERERKGIGNIERIVLGQGVADYGRARMIYDLMQDSDNPEQVLSNYRRMNIATPEVVRQVRQLQRGN